MSTRDLINAIAAGDAIEIENAFNSVMAEKISSRIEEMRYDVAQNLFAEEVEDLDEEQLDELNNKSKLERKVAAIRTRNRFEYDDQENVDREERAVNRVKKQGPEGVKKYKRLANHAIFGKSRYTEEVELNLEDYSLEEIEEFMMSEDFEQLDEISKNTLTSYVDKANKDISSKMADEKRTRNTASNVRDSAHRKYMSGDSAGEKSRQKLGNALINKANKVNKQISNRQQNVAKAQNKIADKIVNKQD